jgi:hypothetical protein
MNTILLLLLFFVILIIILYYKTKKNKETFQRSIAKFDVYVPGKNEKIPYDRIVHRPIEKSIRPSKGNCTNPLYPHRTSKHGKGEMTTPCNLKSEGKNYAMRPILNSNSYYEMLEYLFKSIEDKIKIDDSKMVYPEDFSSENEYSDCMRFMMKKINKGIDTLPLFVDYAKKDTWNGEQVSFLNEKIFVFQKKDMNKLSQQEKAFLARNGGLSGDKKFIVAFTLYNPRRTISVDSVATLYLVNKKFKLTDISFASKKSSTGGLEGQNVSGKGGIECSSLSLKEEPQWIFGNTIDNQVFNKQGFLSSNPEENYTIKGGIPEDLIPLLQKCENSY